MTATDPARLIPVSGVQEGSEAGQHAASALLAAVDIGRRPSREPLRFVAQRLGARRGGHQPRADRLHQTGTL